MFRFTHCAGLTLALTLYFLPLDAHGDGTVLTGTFDGSEPVMQHETGGFDCAQRPGGFRVVPFEVTQPGAYDVGDPYADFYWRSRNQGYVLRVYEGEFAPAAARDPELLDDGRYVLQSDRAYSLVIHSTCAGFEGAWAALFWGPGSVLSDAVAELPSFSRGALTPESPTMTSDCGRGYGDWGWGPEDDLPYSQVGPIRLSRGGEYYYGTVGNDACLAIYTAPVDPARREINRVALLSGFHVTATLEADTDYWFVSHAKGGEWHSRYGSYLHILVPPAPFRINAGLNGAWHDPDTPGEGYFISVFDAVNQLFLASFTAAATSTPGDPFGHRWYTASGPISGRSADLDIELTQAGAFNASIPAPLQVRIGRMLVQFSDCSRGLIVIDSDMQGASPQRPREIPLRRLAGDWEDLCRSQYSGLAEVGPL